MGELTYLFAILLALGASLSNASQSLFIRKGTDRGATADALIVVVGVNVVVLLPLVSFYYYPDYGLTWISWVSFIAAGVVGTLVGRAFKYTSIERIGASRTDPIIASNALFVPILGVLILGETLSLVHALGIVLIVLGVAVIAWETSHGNRENLPRRDLLIGIFIPFGAALVYGAEPLLANIGFAEGTPAAVGLVVKTTSAVIGFLLYLWWTDALPDVPGLRSRNTSWFVLAGFANTLFLLGYYVALDLAPVSVIFPIMKTSTLFVVVLSAIFMPRRLERVTWLLATAATIVVVGVLVVTISG